MNRKFEIVAGTKTYATEANADKAVLKAGLENFRHFIMRTSDNRFIPVFVGQEAIQAGVHFQFHVVG